MPNQPILFDFVSRTVFVAGSSPEADKRYQEFLTQQQQAAQAAKPTER